MTHSKQHKCGNQYYQAFECMTDTCILNKSSSWLSCISIIHLPAISREDVLVAVVPVPVHNLACKPQKLCIVKFSCSRHSRRDTYSKPSIEHHCTEPWLA